MCRRQAIGNCMRHPGRFEAGTDAVTLLKCPHKIPMMIADVANQHTVVVIWQNKMLRLIDARRFTFQTIWTLHTFKTQNLFCNWKTPCDSQILPQKEPC